MNWPEETEAQKEVGELAARHGQIEIAMLLKEKTKADNLAKFLNDGEYALSPYQVEHAGGFFVVFRPIL